jgi:hypothetical protein
VCDSELSCKWFWFYNSPQKNEEYYLKTEVVPPVCPTCSMCPSSGVCNNCGGNGGSGCSSVNKTYKDSSGNTYVLDKDANGVEKYFLLSGYNTPTVTPGKAPTVTPSKSNNFVDETGNTITNVVDTTGSTISGLANTTGNTITKLADTTGGIINSTLGTVENAFNTTANLAGGIVGTTADLAGGIVGTTADLAKGTGSGLYNIVNNNSNASNIQLGQSSSSAPLGSHSFSKTPIDNYSYYGALQSKGGVYIPVTADFSAFRK